MKQMIWLLIAVCLIAGVCVMAFSPDRSPAVPQQIPTQTETVPAQQEEAPAQATEAVQPAEEIPTQPEETAEAQEEILTQPEESAEVQEEIAAQPTETAQPAEESPAQPEESAKTQEDDAAAAAEEESDGQNPVMNFVGNYQCGRARAKVECVGKNEARVTIEWGGNAWQLARWDIVGPLDLDTLTVAYSDCTKSILVYGDKGELRSQRTEYEDGTGTIVFSGDGSFTWHEDQSADGQDMLFEWVPVTLPAEESAAEAEETVPEEAETEETPAVTIGRL